MRHWKSLTTSFATLCARLSSIAGLMITNGIAGRLMTHDQFGLWIILLSINLLTNGFDLGFTFTMGIRLAALGSRGEEAGQAEEERRQTFLSIFFLELIISALLVLLVLLFHSFIPWARWFKVTDPLLITQVRQVMPIVLPFMVSTLPFTLANGVLYAYHEVKLASFLVAITAVLQVAIFAVAAYKLPFTQVLVVYFVANVALGVLLTGYVLIRRRWRITWVPLTRSLDIIRSLARVSFHAFLLGLPAIFTMMLGPFVSGLVAGLGAAGDFNLFQKLFSFLVTAHLSILAPFGPAITKEAHSGQWDSVRHRLRICLLQIFPAFFLILGGLIWYAHPTLIWLWVGRTLTDYRLAALLFAWALISSFVNTFSIFLNSLGLVKLQAAIGLATLVPSLILPIFLGKWMGPFGIALAMVLCAIPAAVILPFYTRRALRLQFARA